MITFWREIQFTHTNATHFKTSTKMTPIHPNQKRILEFNFDDHSEEKQRRVCLEVPCTVRLSHCNVITWFQQQVHKKMKKSNKWSVYEDKQKTISFLRRRGSFLYEKYLAGDEMRLKEYNRRFLRYIVWVEFVRQDHPEDDDGDRASEFSINTIFDTASLLQRTTSSLSLDSDSMTIVTPAYYQFDYDLDKIITSTQRSEEFVAWGREVSWDRWGVGSNDDDDDCFFNCRITDEM